MTIRWEAVNWEAAEIVGAAVVRTREALTHLGTSDVNEIWYAGAAWWDVGALQFLSESFGICILDLDEATATTGDDELGMWWTGYWRLLMIAAISSAVNLDVLDCYNKL